MSSLPLFFLFSPFCSLPLLICEAVYSVESPQHTSAHLQAIRHPITLVSLILFPLKKKALQIEHHVKSEDLK